MLSPRTAIAVQAILLLTLTGCGGNGPYLVTGRVETEEGQPLTDLAGSTILFSSDESGYSASGEIRPDATFKLTTTKPDDGAFPGKYKVTISQPHPQPARGRFDKRVVDRMYEDPQTSPLEATIEAKSNEVAFKLKRAPDKKR
jgi:hypothetical protein